MASPPHKRYRDINDNYQFLNSDSTIVPSQVVYVKDLKQSVTEADFHDALSHFGPIAYVLCIDNDKALVEFENLNSASECVRKAKLSSINIAGYPATFEFSKSSCIRRLGLESQCPSNVLVLSVYNVLYPITVDVIYQISSQHGDVYRIALLKGKENFEVQALVEFDSITTARRAKHGMNGADIYAGCCTLKVEFSVLKKVNVLCNSHDQWDYTVKLNAPFPSSTIFNSGNIKSIGFDLTTSTTIVNNNPTLQYNSKTTDSLAYSPTSPDINPMHVTPAYNPAFITSYINSSIKNINAKKRKFDKNLSLSMNNGSLSKSPVIMVYGLDVDYFNCDRVFNLICSYGDCLKVKFLRSMAGTCMAEMKNAEDAQNVIQHLRGCTIFDKDLEFTFSRNETLRDPTTDVYKLPDQTPSFKDFTNSRNLRFNNPEVASKNKLVYPTKQLHFFNAPASMTEERIRKIFENHGIVPVEIIMTRKKSERSSSGFVTFNNTSEALEALVICNHTPVKEPEIRNPYIFKLAFALEKEDNII